MFQVLTLTSVQLLIGATSWTRILEDLTHHLGWSVRFELTGQERCPWPNSRPFWPQHTSVRSTHAPSAGASSRNTLYSTTMKETSLKISKLWKVCKLNFFVLLDYSIQNAHVISCMFCFCCSFSFRIIAVFWLTGCNTMTFVTLHFYQIKFTKYNSKYFNTTIY